MEGVRLFLVFLGFIWNNWKSWFRGLGVEKLRSWSEFGMDGVRLFLIFWCHFRMKPFI